MLVVTNINTWILVKEHLYSNDHTYKTTHEKVRGYRRLRCFELSACCLGGNTILILTVQTGVLRRHDPPSHQLLSVKYDDNVNGVHGIGCS